LASILASICSLSSFIELKSFRTSSMSVGSLRSNRLVTSYDTVAC
jgi:hypothetical protein